MRALRGWPETRTSDLLAHHPAEWVAMFERAVNRGKRGIIAFLRADIVAWPAVEHDIGPHEAKRHGAPAHAGHGTGAAMQHAEMEDDEVAGFEVPGEDVEIGAMLLDVGQPRQLRILVQRRGVVMRREGRAVVQRALVRAAHE